MSSPRSEMDFASGRHFQVWTFTVGHSQLLLRSVKSDTESTRVDVLFKGVERLNLPQRMDGLRITGSGPYALSGDGWSGEVEALGCWVAEDEGEYFDPSPFHEGSGI